MNFDQMTHKERLLWLAEQEVNCPCRECHPDKSGVVQDTAFCYPGPCSVCKGLGKVPRFPSLRQPCPNEWCGAYKNVVPPCITCQGLGWVPVDSLEATLDAAESTEMRVVEFRLYDQEGKGADCSCLLTKYDGSIRTMGEGNTLNEAAILALCEEMADED